MRTGEGYTSRHQQANAADENPHQPQITCPSKRKRRMTRDQGPSTKSKVIKPIANHYGSKPSLAPRTAK